MKVINKYIYPTSTRAEIEGLRHYTVDGEEKPLPSVTTILGKTQPKEKQESLARWRERIGTREAEKITRDAAIRGTAMHKYLEDLIQGERSLDLSGIGLQAQKMAEVIVDRGLNRCSEVNGIEAVLYYPGLYAGQTDLVGVHKGADAIIDFKQTNKPKKREWIDDYFLQLSAYAMAHNILFNTQLAKGVIMMCSKDNYYQEFVVEGSEFQKYKHNFLRRVDEYYKLRNEKTK